jgi:hypothetical protein
LQFSSDFGAFFSLPRTFPGYPSKFAQFGNPLLPVGERERLAWVMHCLLLAGSGITILVCGNFDRLNV